MDDKALHLIGRYEMMVLVLPVHSQSSFYYKCIHIGGGPCFPMCEKMRVTMSGLL